MPAQNEPATGMDFWAAIGVGQEPEDEPEESPAQDQLLVNGAAAPADTAAPESPAGAEEQKPQDDWASLFSAWDDSAGGAPPAAAQPAAPPAAPKTQGRKPKKPEDAAGKQPPTDVKVAQAPETPAPEAGQAPSSARASSAPPSTPFAPAGQAAQPAAPPQAPKTAQTSREVNGATAQAAPAADPAWTTAERIATSLRPRVAELWLEVLTRHTDGDPAMASRVYHVLNGTHLLGELMRDETIDEVHVHGTQVTVCGANGIRQIPGFPNLTASRRAVKTIAASREKRGLVVSKVGDSVVISRRDGTVPNTDVLLAGGVVTEDQIARIRGALGQMQAVTVTGPAARIVIRALASLIPDGSRVFLGAYAALPAGCVTAVSPMEADYVLGVRPGAVAEEMAAAGQVGALIANPETQFQPALRFAVTGPSAAPEKLVDR
ncbi:hypothetical protein [Spirillospora sp. CA-128828]|uniref:hypothetical protein n=1 Tax=Spirillospora sp. CA-128828 TaxID=3240033 RepID=UPI003D92D29D